MPIFSRRVVQRMIDASPAFMSDRQASKLVADLNGDSKNVIPWEWELAILNGLGQLG